MSSLLLWTPLSQRPRLSTSYDPHSHHDDENTFSAGRTRPTEHNSWALPESAPRRHCGQSRSLRPVRPRRVDLLPPGGAAPPDTTHHSEIGDIPVHALNRQGGGLITGRETGTNVHGITRLQVSPRTWAVEEDFRAELRSKAS